MRFIFAVLVASLFVPNDFAEGAELTCQEKETRNNKKLLTFMGDCTKSLNLKTVRDKSTKANCVMKCVLKTVGMLNSEGKATKENTEAFFVSYEISQKAIAKLRPQFYHCIDSTDGGGRESDDDSLCQSYVPIIKCLMSMKQMTCKEEMESGP